MGKEGYMALGSFDSPLSAGTLWNRLTIGVAALEIKIGAGRLANRSSLFLSASSANTDVIYIGVDNTVASSKYFIELQPGDKISLSLKIGDDVQLWGVSGTAGQYLGVSEVA